MSHGISTGLLFGLLTGGFNVSSGTVEWSRSSFGTDFDDPEIASTVSEVFFKELLKGLF